MVSAAPGHERSLTDITFKVGIVEKPDSSALVFMEKSEYLGSNSMQTIGVQFGLFNGGYESA